MITLPADEEVIWKTADSLQCDRQLHAYPHLRRRRRHTCRRRTKAREFLGTKNPPARSLSVQTCVLRRSGTLENYDVVLYLILTL